MLSFANISIRFSAWGGVALILSTMSAAVLGQTGGMPTVPTTLQYRTAAFQSGFPTVPEGDWRPRQEVPLPQVGRPVAAQLTASQLSLQDFADPIGSVPKGNFTATRPQGNFQNTLSVPIQGMGPGSERLQIQRDPSSPQVVSIYAQGVDLRVVLAHLADESQVNIVVAENLEATVTTTLRNVPLWEALDAILRINGFVWSRKDNIIFVTRPGESGTATPSGSIPGQRMQVFDLNYTSAEEVLQVVNGLLSPAGKAFSHAVDITSTRQTRERIIVEDFPDRLDAISFYLASVDNPPRQVLIEAHVMQVTLDGSQRHGVNLLGLARVAGAEVTLQAQGFANAAANPGFMMGLTGSDLNGMIETLQSNSDVRTLAAPKVLVVDGQEARIQIGSKFGYFVTTTTQTSTLQNVDFLDIGVVLQVQPTITHDGQVLLTVEPKVSGGRINPDSGLPEEETTEAKTTVLLPDGRGMIIGGLMKEADDHQETKIPWLGQQPIIGKFFSRTNDSSERIEVIIALTPHVVPYSPAVDAREREDYLQSTQAAMLGDTYVTPAAAFVPQNSWGMAPHPIPQPNRYGGMAPAPQVGSNYVPPTQPISRQAMRGTMPR